MATWTAQASRQPDLRESISFRTRYENYIGGLWVAPVDGIYFDNVTPITGKPFCQIPRSSAADIELAIDAAHAAKDGWARTSVTQRSILLNQIADRMEEHLSTLALAETLLSITFATARVVFARRRAAPRRSITTRLLIIFRRRWALLPRSFPGISLFLWPPGSLHPRSPRGIASSSSHPSKLPSAFLYGRNW